MYVACAAQHHNYGPLRRCVAAVVPSPMTCAAIGFAKRLDSQTQCPCAQRMGNGAPPHQWYHRQCSAKCPPPFLNTWAGGPSVRCGAVLSGYARWTVLRVMPFAVPCGVSRTPWEVQETPPPTLAHPPPTLAHPPPTLTHPHPNPPRTSCGSLGYCTHAQEATSTKCRRQPAQSARRQMARQWLLRPQVPSCPKG